MINVDSGFIIGQMREYFNFDFSAIAENSLFVVRIKNNRQI